MENVSHKCRLIRKERKIERESRKEIENNKAGPVQMKRKMENSSNTHKHTSLYTHTHPYIDT